MNEDPQRDLDEDATNGGVRDDAAPQGPDDAPTRDSAGDAPTAEAPADADDNLTPVEKPEGAPATQDASHSLSDRRAAEPCPKCGASVPEGALVCVKCGWDFARNEPTRTREEDAASADDIEAAEEGPTAISKPGRLGWKPPLIGGGAAFLAAAILAGVQAWSAAESGKLVQWVVAFLDVVIDGIIRTGLGLAALLFVARILEAPFGKIGLAAARMTLAVGLFYVAYFLARSLGLADAVEWIIGAGVGAALYYIVIMWTFSLERDAVLLVGGAHFILWLAVQAAVLLEMGRRAGFG